MVKAGVPRVATLSTLWRNQSSSTSGNSSKKDFCSTSSGGRPERFSMKPFHTSTRNWRSSTTTPTSMLCTIVSNQWNSLRSAVSAMGQPIM